MNRPREMNKVQKCRKPSTAIPGFRKGILIWSQRDDIVILPFAVSSNGITCSIGQKFGILGMSTGVKLLTGESHQGAV
jgi:hypothetical protein